MKDLILYTTSACHLCNLAEEIVYSIVAPDELVKLDIAESMELFDRYGESIPVLRRKDLTELSWPFDRDMVRSFVSK